MNEDEILEILSTDPGNSIFSDFAEALHKDGASEAAIIVCLRGLSSNPSLHKGRLLLAKIYYDLGFKPFCIEQLKFLLKQLPGNKSISRLLEKLDPQEFNRTTVQLTSEVKTVAEAEFEFGEIELIEEDSKKV
jgi:hypothetical protein